LLQNISISLVTLILLFILCEVLTRIVVYFENQKSFKKAISSLPEITKGKSVSLRSIIQPSKYRKIIYELRPYASVYYENVIVQTNSQGWRGAKEFSLDKDRDTVRVVGLGDSFMFGQGVNQDETALGFLEKELNTRFPQKKWEIINTAVPGYNTVMQIETLQQKVLVYKPDIVMMEIIGNDFDLPNFIYELDSCLDITKSFFIELLLQRFKSRKENFKLFDAPFSYSSNSFENDPRKVPLQYRDMVGWDSFVRAAKELKKLQTKNNFIVIVYRTSSVFDKEIDSLCKQLGFHAIFNFFDWIEDLSLVVSKADRHPNAKQNKKTAEKILNYMTEKEIIYNFLRKR